MVYTKYDGRGTLFVDTPNQRGHKGIMRGSTWRRPRTTAAGASRPGRRGNRRGGPDPKRDSKLHALLQKSSGTKPLGLRTFGSSMSLRRAPRPSELAAPRSSRPVSSAGGSFAPAIAGAAGPAAAATGNGGSVPRLNLVTLDRHNRAMSGEPLSASTPNLAAMQQQHLKNHRQQQRQQRQQQQKKKRPSMQQRQRKGPSSYRPSTVATYRSGNDGPSTLRRHVEAGRRSEWAQIVAKDLEAYREEQTYAKQAERARQNEYAQEIRETIKARSGADNPLLRRAAKQEWSRVLEREQKSNNIVKRTQKMEEKRKARELKLARDAHVARLRAKRAEEAEYHRSWNAKIVDDAKESVVLGAHERALKVQAERTFARRAMEEHRRAKLAQERQKQEALKEEAARIKRHNARTAGQYVSEKERRQVEQNRVGAIQDRLERLGRTWVGRDAAKRFNEQRQFEQMVDTPVDGLEAEKRAMRLMKEQKKRGMAQRRRELLQQMVAKKERKMRERVHEADFALSSSAEQVKAGMYQVYVDEEKARQKAQYARELKEQMERRRKVREGNPEGIHARMTEAERTLNIGTLRKLGIGEHGGRGGQSGKSKRRSKTRAGGTRRTGRGPESQVFLGTYDDVQADDTSAPKLRTPLQAPREAPFAVDTVKVEEPGDLPGLGRTKSTFHGYRRNKDGAYETLMKSSRPGTSDASLYASLRHGHHPRKASSWFDDCDS